MKLTKLFKKIRETVGDDETPVVKPEVVLPQPPVMSGHKDAVVIAQARNPQWVFVRFDGVDGKHAVIIPKRLSGKLAGKRIKVECITDATGTSYRYVHQP